MDAALIGKIVAKVEAEGRVVLECPNAAAAQSARVKISRGLQAAKKSYALSRYGNTLEIAKEGETWIDRALEGRSSPPQEVPEDLIAELREWKPGE